MGPKLMTLYHYCSNEAFLSIATKKQLWLSELLLSNDALEGKWIRQVFRDCCARRGFPAHKQERFLRYLDGLIKFCTAYGFCMSHKDDLLSQFRAYAADGRGVAIGINEEYLRQLAEHKRSRGRPSRFKFLQVEYDEAAQRALVDPHIDEILAAADRLDEVQSRSFYPSEDEQIEANGLNFCLGLRFLPFADKIFGIKHPTFMDEREWRLIEPQYQSMPKMQPYLGQTLFRSASNRIVPYVTMDIERLEIPSIVEIILGPRNTTPAAVVGRLLSKYEWAGVTVRG